MSRKKRTNAELLQHVQGLDKDDLPVPSVLMRLLNDLASALQKADPGSTEVVSGSDRKAAGIQRVLNNGSEKFKLDFEKAFRLCLDKKVPFNSEDVMALVKTKPHHPNLIGACMKKFVTHYKMQRYSYRAGERESAHSRMISRWMREDWK